MSIVQPGARIAERYRIEALLATGGMGAVYRATDERLSRPVAIKVLLAELAADTTQMARFEREAMASARLSHPGIVQVHDFGKTDEGLGYLVMELVSGRTVASHLDVARLEPPRAVDIADQALAALGAAHAAGIIHRDLKPANLMLVPLGGGREHVKVLDFGIAQLKSGEVYTRLTATGDILGTPSYMAPEQARSEPCDPRTDVYGMGMVLWSCLTGEKPWGTQHIAQMVIAVQTELPRRADLVCGDVPKAVGSIVEKAVAKRPEDRFASAAEFASALKRASSAITPATRAPLPNTQASPFARGATPVMKAAALPEPGPTRAVSPAPILSPGPSPSPAPGPSPVPALSPAPRTPAPLSSLPLAPGIGPTPAPIAAPITTAPKKPRWWLRILVVLLILLGLGAAAAVALVVGVLFLGWQLFNGLPNAQHPALGSGGGYPTAPYAGGAEVDDGTCAAAARCCELAEGDECSDYLAQPPDLEACREAIGTYGDQLQQDGEDASPCSPTWYGP